MAYQLFQTIDLYYKKHHILKRGTLINHAILLRLHQIDVTVTDFHSVDTDIK